MPKCASSYYMATCKWPNEILILFEHWKIVSKFYPEFFCNHGSFNGVRNDYIYNIIYIYNWLHSLLHLRGFCLCGILITRYFGLVPFICLCINKSSVYAILGKNLWYNSVCAIFHLCGSSWETKIA